MLIQVTEAGELQLTAPLDFERFSIAVHPRVDASRARTAISRIARLDGEAYAWVSQEGLRALATGAGVSSTGAASWEEGFARMVAFASRKGWLDEYGGIRAHIKNLSGQGDRNGLPPIETAAFKSAMRNLVGGVAIVATGSGAYRQGLTISAITSVSAEPPCILVCVNTSSQSHDPILANGAFGVSLLGQEHEELALRFAGVDDIHGVARFNLGDWYSGTGGSPLLSSALCTLDCQVVLHQTVGSHGIFIGEVIESRVCHGAPLVNFQGRLRTLDQGFS